MSGTEGVFPGTDGGLSPDAIMECGVCWTPYDPAEGDEFRQIAAGTPFLKLPQGWTCPGCDAPRGRFHLLDDPGGADARRLPDVDRAVRRLEADFRDLHDEKMRDLPLVNSALEVEAVAFRLHGGRPVGALVTPLFLNLVLLPATGEDWSGLETGEHEVVRFPSGDYEFIHDFREKTGGFKACSIFSPMTEFDSQAQAVEVARTVLAALLDPAAQRAPDARANPARDDDATVARERRAADRGKGRP